MQVKVSARHGHLSGEHQAEISARAEKLLHYFDRLTFIEVTVDLQHEAKKVVEIIATAEHKHEFIGHADGADVLVALGAAVDKVVHQIKHYKERLQDHRRDPSHGGHNGIKP
ncbi:HPF/RaiA family ribosome-associated protein [Fimbriiglobus ruber]|uniref:Putative sigma-54 modulation protein n=1 Tax=Fimbriiglobus ruber TaxID=1908690 RepID=A0A225EDX6_9BACT|nr:HPF/RaiA family ribosome-associated protein [Fimbriiglobus ruber]OWK46517.1 putative sigma-54 modulation protein [Fimbriiglobus ruber]